MTSTRRGGGGGPIGAGRCGATSAWVRQVRAVDGADMRRMETGERGSGTGARGLAVMALARIHSDLLYLFKKFQTD
jgi:hypothetical protein